MSVDVDNIGRTRLHIAAGKNDLNQLEHLLKTVKQDVNDKDYSGRTVLHCLLNTNAFDELEDVKRGILLLQRKGADINAQDNFGKTPVHLVLEHYCELIPDIVSFIFKLFPTYNHKTKDTDGNTVFHIFMSNIQSHVEEREDITDILSNRESFIKQFIDGKIATICEKDIKYLLNDKNNSGYSTFQTYVDGDHCHEETIKLMIKHGAHVNCSNDLGITPLMQSVIRKRDEVADILLQNGADPNATDIFGQTALFRVRSVKAFHLLNDYGATVDTRDRIGKLAVMDHSFFTSEDLPYGEMFIEQNLSQFQPLAELFFSRGVNPNTKDKYGSTLLHYAAWWSDEGVIKILLQNKADKQIQDNRGMTPYDIAIYHGNYNISHLLQYEDQQNVDENAIKNNNIIRRYFRFAINSEEIENMENVLSILGIKDDPCKLIDLALESPMFGLTNRKCESLDVKSSINNVMQKAACLLSELDFRFRTTVKPTGSSSEGTMVGDPCEFDFIFCLDYFEEECKVMQPDNLLETGFVFLAIASQDDKHHPLVPFVSDNGYICAGDVRSAFQDHVVNILNKQNLWVDEHIYFDGLVEIPEDKPILKLQIQWYGGIYKNIVISVDVVPAIFKQNWFPREIDKSSLTLCNDTVKHAGFFLLFHGPQEMEENDANYLRISSAAIEITFFRNSPEIYRECYAISKILKHRCFCPSVQFDDSENEEYDTDEELIEQTGTHTFEKSVESRSEPNEIEIDVKPIEKSHKIHFTQNLDRTEDCSDGSKFTKDVETENVHRNASGWLVEVDEERKIRKLYTPKIEKRPHGKSVKSADKVECQLIDHVDSTYQKESENEEGKTIIFPATTIANTLRTGVNSEVKSTNKDKETLKQIERYNQATMEDDTDNKPENEVNGENENEINHPSYESSNENIFETQWEGGDKPENEVSGENENKIHHPSNESSNEDIFETQWEGGDKPENEVSGENENKIHHLSNESSNENIFETQWEGGDKPENEVNGENENEIHHPSNESSNENMFETQWEGGDIAEADEYITSYMLKNCLFHVLCEIRQSGSDFKITRLDLAIRIYEYLLKCAQNRSLRAYCMPFLNIFTYVNEYILKVSKDDLEEELIKLCERISHFCRVILGILKQNNTATD